MARIFKLTEKAINEMMGWDKAIYSGEIETVEEFGCLENALKALEDDGYDTDFYGVE